MRARHFSTDSESLIDRVAYLDDAEQKITIASEQDVTDIVEANREASNHFDERSSWTGDLHRVASIPMVVYWDLKARGIIDDDKKFKAWLNDPDNKAFRTRGGRV